MQTNSAKIGILTLALCFALSAVVAQKQSNNWYFGNGAGISFAGGTVSVLTDGVTDAPEGVATISDKYGNLLFYTDGITIWNRQHHYMQHATHLPGHFSSTQSAIIVPQPGNDSLFYVFTVDAFGGIKGLQYTIVNMNWDNGLGDVIQFPIQLLTPTCEKVTAIKHCNNKDIWIITRSRTANAYYAWLLTAGGLSASPVISTVSNSPADDIGYLKGSPDGKKLVAVNYYSTSELSEFDNINGIVSNTVRIAERPVIAGSDEANSYGAEFSPDSKMLYISTSYSQGVITFVAASVDQYQIGVHDSTAIANSHYTVTTDANMHSAMQLGYNNKIYVAENRKSKLSCINQPNLQGAAAGFQLNAIDLGGGICFNGLPTFIQSLFNPLYGGYDFSYAGDCNPLLQKFSINDLTYVDSVKWNFDDAASGSQNTSTALSPTHQFNAFRVYSVLLKVYYTTPCISGVDTIEKVVIPASIKFSLGKDKEVCEGRTVTIDATMPGNSSYLWSTGATSATITVDQPGQYWCKLLFNSCEYSDTIIVKQLNRPDFSFTDVPTICNDQPVLLKAAVDPAWQIQWQDGSTQNPYTATAAGIYSLTATNECGSTVKQVEIKKGACELYMPLAFTPNGDTKNDVFKALGTELISKFQLQIFNRYGELVFNTTDKNKGWDGNYKGKAASPGVYIYIVKYKYQFVPLEDMVKGSFLLIR